MGTYIITHTPTQAHQNAKGKPVTYASEFDAMVALVAWAKECDLPASDFIVSEYKPDFTKFAYNPNKK
jgi:hypothetical protein